MRRAGLIALLLLAAPGCVLLDTCKSCKTDAPPSPGPVHQVVATWSNQVHYAPDVVNGGIPTPGFVGRLYLFGPEIDHPQVGDGCLTVELYDEGGPRAGVEPVERWTFDAATLHRLLRKDIVGWGYTLWLPWGGCRPDVARVHLAAQYTPAAGTPLYAPGAAMTLDHSAAPPGHGVATASATAPARVAPAPPRPQPPAPGHDPMPLHAPRAVP
jgi:hypothetical protein